MKLLKLAKYWAEIVPLMSCVLLYLYISIPLLGYLAVFSFFIMMLSAEPIAPVGRDWPTVMKGAFATFAGDGGKNNSDDPLPVMCWEDSE